MKNLLLLSTAFLAFFASCGNDDQDDDPGSLSCVEYWASVAFSDFCGLTMDDFDFNTIPNDICNADQTSSFPFDDLISIRVFNHFSDQAAKEEYDLEEDDFKLLPDYTPISNLGDDAFAILTTAFGELDQAIVQVVQGPYTVYLEINGNAVNGANNCFDESSAVEFARALVSPL